MADFVYFLRERTAFIRQFYDAASAPFVETKRKIEAREPPYEPGYSEGESDEPPFLDQWITTDESLQVVGYTCVSMLSAALVLFFAEWERRLRIPLGDSGKDQKGPINKYRAYFLEHAGIRFADASADLGLLGEIVLTRNRVQHPPHLALQRTSYSESDLKKLPRAFFISEMERRIFPEGTDLEPSSSWLMPPSIHIDRDNLFAAVAEVERFAEWLDGEMNDRIYGQR